MELLFMERKRIMDSSFYMEEPESSEYGHLTKNKMAAFDISTCDLFMS